MGTITDALRNMVRTHLSSKKMESVIEEKLTDMMPGLMRNSFRRSPPGRELTEVGFRWACWVALSDYWPSVAVKDAADWLTEYVDAPYGAEGHDWTYAAAKDLAREYVSEFGEHGK